MICSMSGTARKNSISSPPPLPLSSVEGGEDAETDTPREDSEGDISMENWTALG